ncbi:RraA family protein [Marivita hallyeonensis]|uniref:Putative 4-hydroxy-4-methyl-2-oxoglutarate aldolase n=1 Tax=Marivita hallyeonensis TaxID=996342 RepID=A0A1M5SCK8_9RHOB|nr:RraA family protein [Marivita hallyeonensis]SHH36180.1 4-hydroxy-4-methyl-2-oxoglutarate aldolase [Marivita hallyeonensis]
MTLSARLRCLGAASLFEAAGKSGAMEAGIKPVRLPSRVVGRAVTVKVGEGDNLALHRLLAEDRKGDVIVVDAGGRTDIAIWGDVLSAAARGIGYRGLVVDGAVRDAAAIDPDAFPIFARGTAIPGPGKRDPGSRGQPITCGGVMVCDGDWIVGDADGVVVLPMEKAEDIVIQAEARERQEADMIARLLERKTTTLEELGLDTEPA